MQPETTSTRRQGDSPKGTCDRRYWYLAMNRELIKRIVRAGVKSDTQALTAAVKQLASSESKQGHKNFAEELRAMVREPHLDVEVRRYATPPVTPKDLEGGIVGAPPRSKGEAAPLIDVRWSRKSFHDMVLGERPMKRICRFLEEYTKQDRLAAVGLTPKRKLLFFGPPGNGKTLCAEVIAGELEIPLFYVRFDSLVASYLGETAANLRRVFEFANSNSGVVFFDEFDAIGKTRDSRDDVGELKRVVNSFLQLLDSYSGHGPIIAATNYEKLLDHALARRFDDLIHFSPPSEKQLVSYFQGRMKPFRVNGFTAEEAAGLCKDCSFSDADRIFTESLKTIALERSPALTSGAFREAVESYKHSGSAYDTQRTESH
jgi:AAA+ superfamily predicted ATPase